MISRQVAFLGCMCFAAVGICQEAEFRHWTTEDGKRSPVRLQLLKSNDDFVQLKREDNGKLVTMKIATLSKADQNFLSSLAEKNSDPAGPAAGESAGGWNQWRGPMRDGKSPDTGIMTQWPGNGPELLWNITGLGVGYSTPAVVGDTAYVLGTRGSDEFLFALSTNDGSKLWESRFGTRNDGGGFAGPKGTPAIDGDHIYVLGGGGDLVCMKRDGGDIKWAKNLKSDFGGKTGHWQYAESPLIDGDRLLCTPGGGKNTIVALDKSSGRKIWGAGVGAITSDGFATAGYASIIKANLSQVDQYIVFLHGGVVGLEAKSGQPLWHYDNPANDTANCSTPIAFGDAVFAASGYGTGGGLAMISRRGNQWNVNEKYFVNKMQSHHGGFILHEGHIYGTNESALLCIEWNSGRIKWQDRCVGKGSTTFVDGHLIVRGESGSVALVVASPSGFQEQGRFEQADRSNKKAWAHPVVVDGKLYLHDHGRMLCYKVGK